MKLKSFKNWTILYKNSKHFDFDHYPDGPWSYVLYPSLYGASPDGRKRAGNQGVVEVASSIIASLQEDVKNGKISVEQAKEEALKTIRFLKYHGNEYFWVMDFEPKILTHGVSENLIGKNVGDIKDPDGKHLFVEMVKNCKRKR